MRRRPDVFSRLVSFNAPEKRMDTDSLKIFVEVMRRGSFVAVARDRNLDPSSISRAIRSLEEELGIRLFQRTTRALTPTQSAIAYFDRISVVVDEIEKANLIVSDADRPPHGLIKITTSVAFGKRCIVPLLPEFLKLYPDLSIELLLSDSLLDLVNERIDVAIRLGLLPDSTFVAHKLLPTKYAVVASPAYLKHSESIDWPLDLVRHKCVLFPYPGYRERWIFRDRSGSTFKVPVSGRVTVSSAIGVLAGAVEGIGPALLADWLTEAEVRKGKLVRLLRDFDVAATSFDTAIWFMYSSKAYLPLRVRVFLDFLRVALPRKFGTPETVLNTES